MSNKKYNKDKDEYFTDGDFTDEDYIDKDFTDENSTDENDDDMEIIIEENEEINEEDQQQIPNEDHEIERENEEEINTSISKKRSWVWNYFSYNKELQKSRCNLCKALITSSKGSTTGMSNHLKSKHSITKNGKEKQQKQLTLQESIQDSNKNMVSLRFYLILFSLIILIIIN
jgi:BED zinc finger